MFPTVNEMFKGLATANTCPTATFSGESVNGLYLPQQTDNGVVVDEAKCVYPTKREYSDVKLDVDGARTYCSTNAPKGSCEDCIGDLVVVYTSAQDDLINDNMADESYVYGVYRPCNHCAWQTYTGVPIGEMAWAPWEPNGSGRGDNCIEMFVRGEKEDDYRGKLNDMHCDNLDGENYAIPMCQVYQEKLPTIPDLDDWQASGGCQVGWQQFGKGCFKYFGDVNSADTLMQWDSAESFCASQVTNGHLATLKAKAYEHFLASFMKGTGRDAWIGASVKASDYGSNYKHPYEWQDGTPVMVTNWAPDEPNGRTDLNRRVQVHWNGVIDIDGHRPGQWKDVDDGDDWGWEEKAPPAAYVCSAPRDRNYQSGQVRFQIFVLNLNF